MLGIKLEIALKTGIFVILEDVPFPPMVSNVEWHALASNPPFPSWLDAFEEELLLAIAAADFVEVAVHVANVLAWLLFEFWYSSGDSGNKLLRRRRKATSVSMPWSIPVTLMVLWGVFWRFPAPASPVSSLDLGDDFDLDTWFAAEAPAFNELFNDLPSTSGPDLSGYHRSPQTCYDFQWPGNIDTPSFLLDEETTSTTGFLFSNHVNPLAGLLEMAVHGGSTTNSHGVDLAEEASDHPIVRTTPVHQAPIPSVYPTIAPALAGATVEQQADGPSGNVNASPPAHLQRSNPTQASTLDPNLSCDQCPNQRFLRVCDLKRHQRERHERTLPFKCPVSSCRRHVEGFERKENRDRHFKLRHHDGAVLVVEKDASGAITTADAVASLPQASAVTSGLAAGSIEQSSTCKRLRLHDGAGPATEGVEHDLGNGSSSSGGRKRLRQTVEEEQDGTVVDALKKDNEDLREENRKLREDLTSALRELAEERRLFISQLLKGAS
ncbi:hypothetical protein B0H66DRAFT_595885 [Apodospora peruviana]|uniref:C2H2-type domain-containing protein n=1 Tax=Apodospora peruviana TaxID=516989 RepID=A0AAE0LYD4_9PEZI|nr:hypothetical protein B0H66DRAFT_595885 [Apodospora peruviana]